VAIAGRQSGDMTDVLAAIDIGTNSIHLVVARVGENRIEVLEREREMVRLGSSAGDMKRLRPAAINRGIEVLDRYKQIAAIHGASVRAVATSAVREAANRAVFLDRAREVGVDVEVISGGPWCATSAAGPPSWWWAPGATSSRPAASSWERSA
jgi:exopolyphosphatase/pppGpp-phosphohydrolase